MNVRTTAAALAAVALSFGLTACSGGQSVDEACSVAEKEVKAAMGDLGSINPTDTASAASTIKSLTAALEKTESDLENAEVKKAIGDLAADFGKLETAFADLNEAGTDSAKLQEVSSELTTLSTDIQKKGEELDELCG